MEDESPNSIKSINDEAETSVSDHIKIVDEVTSNDTILMEPPPQFDIKEVAQVIDNYIKKCIMLKSIFVIFCYFCCH